MSKSFSPSPTSLFVLRTGNPELAGCFNGVVGMGTRRTPEGYTTLGARLEELTATIRESERYAKTVRHSPTPNINDWRVHAKIAAMKEGLAAIALVFGSEYAKQLKDHGNPPQWPQSSERLFVPFDEVVEEYYNEEANKIDYASYKRKHDYRVSILLRYVHSEKDCRGFTPSGTSLMGLRRLFVEQHIVPETFYRMAVSRAYLAMEKGNNRDGTSKRIPMDQYVLPPHIEDRCNGRGASGDMKESIAHGFASEWMSSILRGETKPKASIFRQVCEAESRNGEVAIRERGSGYASYYKIVDGISVEITAQEYAEGMRSAPYRQQRIVIGHSSTDDPKHVGNAVLATIDNPQFVRHTVSAVNRLEVQPPEFPYDPDELWKFVDAANLSGVEREAFMLSIRGLTVTQIAKREGRDKGQISRALSSAQVKVQSVMNVRKKFEVA